MRHFDYRQGELYAEDVPVAQLAEAVGTPFYCYSAATLERHYSVFASALAGLDALVCFAVKANSNQAVLATLARQGAGADVVSLGELMRALAAGIAPEKIVFAGVGKTRAEMAAALDAGIYQFNVESEPELRALNDVACARGVQAPVALRVNPDVDAGTHAKISTGKAENKFGIPMAAAESLYAQAAVLPGIAMKGLSVHIGSQLTTLEPFRAAFTAVGALVQRLRAAGQSVERVNLGGGLGVRYAEEHVGPPLPVQYAALVREVAADWNVRLIFEPGRLIAGNAGVLVSTVLYVKQGAQQTFVIVDAAMNDLLRPTLYDAYHDIAPVREPVVDAPRSLATVVGPVCETGDSFAIARPLPPVVAGDLLLFHTAGAYGAVMASTYNSRLLVPEVMVQGDQFALVRPRGDYAALIGADRLPPWLRP